MTDIPQPKKRRSRVAPIDPDVDRGAPGPPNQSTNGGKEPVPAKRDGRVNGFDDGTLADVVAKAVTAVQSQKLPAEDAIRAAMQALGTAQKSALELALTAAKLQAEVVHGLLAVAGRVKPESFISEVGGLLGKVVDRSPEIISSLSAGLSRILSSPNAVSSRRESQPAAAGDGKVRPPAPKPQQMTEEQLLDAILVMIADGYSAGNPGSSVAQNIRTLYPAAVPTMQKYMAMDDFLVLMWMRQQPAIAKIATDEKFPQFYVELKADIVSAAE